MALSVTVTKQSVSKVQPGLHRFGLRLEVKDGEETVLSQNFAALYKPGYDVSGLVTGLKEQMQRAILDYLGEQQLYNSPQFDNAITTLQNSLEV